MVRFSPPSVSHLKTPIQIQPVRVFARRIKGNSGFRWALWVMYYHGGFPSMEDCVARSWDTTCRIVDVIYERKWQSKQSFCASDFKVLRGIQGLDFSLNFYA